MEDYNTQFCDILKDINKIINPPSGNDGDHVQNVTSKDIDDAINSLNSCQTENKLIKFITYLMASLSNKEKEAATKAGVSELSDTVNSQTKEKSDDDIIYKRLTDLDNKIQSETNYNLSNYSKDIKTINYEQNKQFENNKFNKIYLFLFNIGVIFLILKFSYYKKTN